LTAALAAGGCYEKDRLDPVDPAARVEFACQELERFPEGYRHLAYLQAAALRSSSMMTPDSRRQGS
jgi:hypothetical protein